MGWRNLLLLALGACAGEGGVRIELDLPTESALDPLGGRVAELTLTAAASGELLFSATRPAGAGPVDFGRVPVADQVSFELAGAAPGGRVVAFGRSGAPVDVLAEAEVAVPLRLRRPFAYVAGGDSLLAIDATLGPGEEYAASIGPVGPVTAAAVSADGAEVIVAAADGLHLMPTASHAGGGVAVALPGPVVDLAVAPEGDWAIASHAAPEPGVSLIDLAAARAGDPQSRFLPVARPGTVAIGGGNAWVMVEPLDNLFCVGASSVLGFPVADPDAAGEPVPIEGVGGELVADPVSGAALAIRACTDQVVRFAAPGAAPEPFVEIEGATTLAVAGDVLWIMGHVDGEGAHLSLASLPVAGGELLSQRDMSTLEERAQAVALEQTGQGGLVRVTADGSSAFEMVVLPDGEHVAVLVAALYFTDPSGDAGGGQPILPAITLITFEYQLIELATGLGAQRLRMLCNLSWEAGALLDDFVCALAPGQDESPVQFGPTDLAVIYGAR